MLSNDATRASTPAFTTVVPGLSVLRDVFVNLYYAFAADQPQGPWVLIDADQRTRARRHPCLVC